MSAGVAALLLQAAGGKQSLTAAQMRSLLESTAGQPRSRTRPTSIATFSERRRSLLQRHPDGHGRREQQFGLRSKNSLPSPTPARRGAVWSKAIIDIGSADEDFDETLQQPVFRSRSVEAIGRGHDKPDHADLLANPARTMFPDARLIA